LNANVDPETFDEELQPKIDVQKMSKFYIRNGETYESFYGKNFYKDFMEPRVKDGEKPEEIVSKGCFFSESWVALTNNLGFCLSDYDVNDPDG
jgi:hypothetical protein